MSEQDTSLGLAEAGEQARVWIEELRGAQKAVRDWHERGRKIVRRYLDEREGAELERRKFNVLWSNTETLLPVVYARAPKPEVTRRFLDRDPVGRLAADLLERALSATLELQDFDGVLQSVVKDYLLAGRGQAWVRYVAELAPATGNADGPDGVPRAARERIACDYVPWQDFLTNPARVWAEVRWCARRLYLGREDMARAFGAALANEVPLDTRPAGTSEREGAAERMAKAGIWEIWDRPTGKVWFIHPGYGVAPLKVADAPFALDGFFPCPRPLSATTANDSLVPVPDYAEYQDQAEELDELTARIAALQKALKVVGVYDSSVTALQGLLSDGADHLMVPVDQWQGFGARGGLQGALSFLPLAEVAQTLVQLYEARRRVKEDLYEITGISDILRGSSLASETATAQSIKAQWGSIRVQQRQREVARFSRDLLRINAEIMAEMFAPESLAKIAGVAEMTPEQQQVWPLAAALLRDGAARQFRIEIETDSTLLPDEQAEKGRVTEFLAMLGGFLREALPVAQAAPPLIPVMGEVLSAATRRFRFGRPLEMQIEQAMAQLAQRAAVPPAPQGAAGIPGPPPANPALAAAQMNAQTRAQIEGQKAQGQLQVAQAKAAGELYLKQQKLNAELALERRRTEARMAADAVRGAGY